VADLRRRCFKAVLTVGSWSLC